MRGSFRKDKKARRKTGLKKFIDIFYSIPGTGNFSHNADTSLFMEAKRASSPVFFKKRVMKCLDTLHLFCV
jgi:hypothetical protein